MKLIIIIIFLLYIDKKILLWWLYFSFFDDFFLLIVDVVISFVNEIIEDGLDNCVVDEVDEVDIVIDVFFLSLWL